MRKVAKCGFFASPRIEPGVCASPLEGNNPDSGSKKWLSFLYEKLLMPILWCGLVSRKPDKSALFLRTSAENARIGGLIDEDSADTATLGTAGSRWRDRLYRRCAARRALVRADEQDVAGADRLDGAGAHPNR
jgi:hypothetical protein